MTDNEFRELYHGYIAALNGREFDTIDRFVADEIAFGTQVFTRAQIVDMLKAIVDAVPDFHWEVRDILINGDRAAVSLWNAGTPEKQWQGVDPTGKSFRIGEQAIYRVDGGKFVEMLNVFDVAEAARQLAAD